MNKTFIFIVCILIIILSIFGMKYLDYKDENAKIKQENLEYEVYLNKEVSGRDLTTAINRAINSNDKNKVSKDENGMYIENNTNSIKIEIKFLEMDKIISSDAVIKNGIEKFVQNFATMSFKCSKIEYHQSTKLVKYMYFEQF